MTDSWVGFRPSPKRDESRPTASQSFEATSELLIGKVLKLLTTQPGVESWLVSFTKFDARLGAKLKFSLEGENYGGTYARIDIPKRVIMLTELHGTEIVLNCSKTLNQQEKLEWEKLVQETFSRFQKALSNAG
jgi:hypothetical protein